MALTGPQKFPGANITYWYQGAYPGSAMESNVGVIHTTEGTSLPGYDGGATAPNFTALPDIPNRRLRWYQHFDFDVSSRALRNLSGGVETNTLNVVQVELVGTCDPKYRTGWGSKRAGVDYLYWPDAPDWALAELARFVKWAHDQHGIKLQSTVTWKPYPASYGANGVRLTGAEWRAYYGWLGHQHVPENDHGDPGDLDMARVLEHAKGTATTAPTTPEEDDMPSAEEIARAVWGYAYDHGGKTITARTRLGRAYENALAGKTAAQQAVALLGAQSGVLDAIRKAVAAGGGLTAEQAEAAATAGARAALAELGDALTD